MFHNFSGVLAPPKTRFNIYYNSTTTVVVSILFKKNSRLTNLNSILRVYNHYNSKDKSRRLIDIDVIRFTF